MTFEQVRRAREHVRAKCGFYLLEPYWGNFANHVVRLSRDDGQLGFLAHLDGNPAEHFGIEPNTNPAQPAWRFVWLPEID